MGFFDEDESEDESPATVQSSAGIEEEDPLDAYMRGLQEDVSKRSFKEPAASTRMDLLEDDSDAESQTDTNLTFSNQKQDQPFSRGTDQEPSITFVQGKSLGGKINIDDDATTVSQTPENPLIRKMSFSSRSTSMGYKWRQTHNTTLGPIRRHAGQIELVDPILQFSEIRSILGPNLYEIIANDYSEPTPVQSQTLPITLAGKDALVTAATGQGKTLLYVLSCLSHIRHSNSGAPSALVLCPTRELALQVQATVQPLAHACQISSRAIIGGQNKFDLWKELKRSQLDLAIATPGRLLDVVSDKKGFSLGSVGFVVLDEADKMLQMGFDKQVRNILRQVPINRQMLMISATMGNKVGQLSSDLLLPDAVRVTVGRTGEASHHVDQHVMVLPDEAAKESFMIEMVPVLLPLGRTIVFVATKEKCEHLATLLREQTTSQVLTLHGDRHQSDRTSAVRSFRKGDCKLLIASDVASRGLDIPNVQTIVSFDPAKTLDAHVHRVGRAGRLSKDGLKGQRSGSAYTLLTKGNADFAFVLRNSFQREGRAISAELDVLAQSSRKAGMVDIRRAGDKQGLGFLKEGLHSEATPAPIAKKSRWK